MVWAKYNILKIHENMNVNHECRSQPAEFQAATYSLGSNILYSILKLSDIQTNDLF
jgi:hypothetical protein